MGQIYHIIGYKRPQFGPLGASDLSSRIRGDGGGDLTERAPTALETCKEGRFGEYILVERLLRASRFETWRARRVSPDLSRNTPAPDRSEPSAVVLKTCHLGHGCEAAVGLLDEIERAVMVRHPAIAEIHEVGVLGNFFFAAMEYVRGRDLSQVVGGRSLIEPRDPTAALQSVESDSLWPQRSIPVDLALLIAVRVCDGLEVVHDVTGRAHGELSPWHIVVGFDGSVKILNVGLTPIASQLKADTIADSWAIFRYMAPEQVVVGVVDERADLFSLGLVLYELLRGRPWISGDADSGLLGANRCDSSRERIRRLTAPAAVREVLQKALQPDPSHRFQSAPAMGLALRKAMVGASLFPTREALAQMMWRQF